MNSHSKYTFSCSSRLCEFNWQLKPSITCRNADDKNISHLTREQIVKTKRQTQNHHLKSPHTHRRSKTNQHSQDWASALGLDVEAVVAVRKAQGLEAAAC